MKFARLCQTIGLFFQKGAAGRGRYLRKNHILCEVGENVRFQPRLIPLYPELIKLHNNVVVGAGVRFVTHDAISSVLNRLGRGHFPEKVGCIEIMDNVFIGTNSTILPNVRIGENVIIGANTTVTKDLESGGVYAGSPARKIGSFEDYIKKLLPGSGGYSYPTVARNQRITQEEIGNAWDMFAAQRKDCELKV